MLTEIRTLSWRLTQLGARGPHRTSTGRFRKLDAPHPTHTHTLSLSIWNFKDWDWPARTQATALASLPLKTGLCQAHEHMRSTLTCSPVSTAMSRARAGGPVQIRQSPGMKLCTKLHSDPAAPLLCSPFLGTHILPLGRQPTSPLGAVSVQLLCGPEVTGPFKPSL